MGDPFGGWTPSWSEYADRTPPRHSGSFVRLTGKSIYNQRKEYGHTLLRLHNDFQHHVEHLLTMPLEQDLRSAQDCLGRLKDLEEQGRVWGQDVILAVKDQELVLSDVESKDELEAFPLGSVQGCSAGLDNTVLAVSVQERNPPRTSVLLFQCERLGAETLRSSLEKVLRQRKEEQSDHYGHSPDTPPSPAPPYPAPERWAEPPQPDPQEPPQRRLLSSEYRAPDPPQMPRSRPPGQAVPEVERDVVSGSPPSPPRLRTPQLPPARTVPLHPQEILNHVLGDLELFMGRLKKALSSASTKKKRKKPALPPKDGYTDFFQKVKYALNLMGRTHRYVTEPDPPELLRLIFSALSFVLAHCPSPGLAPGVESPLLLPEALEFLEENLSDDDYGVWKSLGTAWNKSRAEYPNSALVPAYTLAFSDGWLPPVMEQELPGHRLEGQSQPSVSVRLSLRVRRVGTRVGPRLAADAPPATSRTSLPAQGLARALYDFQARNSQELSVRKGDTLQVLDQQRKWWLVQDERGDRGHVPGNILEPLPEPGHSPRQDSPPTLRPSSSPAEVTAWLTDKGFSRITVRTLGVLRGHELLQMSPAELRGVCPEEWRRVLFKLSPIRTSLGIAPRD
ncbi:PREDICTED: epidermal growth factor receptor kinase substrate 8-like protein 3 [Pseudopodoces humilis]|uniref:epidermal growth factor receptor kinase substrate 8-like protein 3 n=1 Tax=Pseudopodoces humilis TaxID=181119 RepID=UPI000395529A|nr:PREDICTED: epidermal growth factor receptor kinase substrate 8-like protein 3 [Pseudopodoces humilis]